MDIFKKISKTFITFLLTLMLIFQSVISSFVGATTSFAGNEQNLATITIENTENGTLLFEGSKDKTIKGIKGSNINVFVNPSMGFETSSVKMKTENGKELDLPVTDGKVNVPIIDNAKLSTVFSKSESQPVAVEEEKQDENLNAKIIKEKEKNTVADKSDKRNRCYKEGIDDSETIAEILLKADRSKVGEGTSVIAKDVVTVANTLIDMRKTKAKTLDELWKDRDGDGESDDWMAVEFQFDTVVPLYEVNEKAEYWVAKPNLAKGENYQLLQYLIGDSNMSGTKLNNVSYDKKTGLLYVPKRILFPNDPKYKTDKPIARIGRTRIQFLVGLNKPIKETKAEVKVKIDSEDSVKGKITKSGKAEVNAMANDTKIVLAKDEDAKKSIKANSIDEIRINGHKVNLDNAKYYEKEGVLELPIKPVNTDTIEVKLSNSLVKDVKNVIGSIVEPTISYAANNGKLAAKAFISEWFYFDTSPRAGDVWKLAGTNIYGNGVGAVYEKVYPSNRFGSDSGLIEAVRKILNNTFTNYDIQSIEQEIGTGKDSGFNYYIRHSTIFADTYGANHARSGASLTINNNFNLSLHCAHVGVKTNFQWGDITKTGAGKDWDDAGTYIRLIDTDGESWALFGIVSPTQKKQAGVGFFGVHIKVNRKETPGGGSGIYTPKYKFHVKKVDDSTGETLSGAMFKVTQRLAWGDSAPTQYQTTGYSGKLTFDDLPAGTYEIEEVTPPSGYKKLYDTQTITLPDQDGYEVTFRNTKDDDIPPPTPGPYPDPDPDPDPTPPSPSSGDYAFIMQKVDGYTGLKITGPATYSAKFKVKDPDGLTVWADTHPTADTAKTGNVYVQSRDAYNDEFNIDSINGSFAILGLEKKGTYTIEEISAPSGYNKSSTKQTVTVSDYQKIGTTEFRNYGTPPEPPTPDPPTPETPRGGTLKLKKTDATTGLPIKGAKFQLIQKMPDKDVRVPVTGYTGNYEENYSSSKFYEMETDYNGEIEVKVKETGSSNKYYFEETTPAPGYEKPSNNRTNEGWVVAGTTEDFRMTNTKTPEKPRGGTVKLKKTDATTGLPIKGVKFKLKQINSEGKTYNVPVTGYTGNYEENYSSSNFTEMETDYNGEIEVKVRDTGSFNKYYFEETTPAPGYEKPSNNRTNEEWVVAGGTETYEMTNTKETIPEDGVIRITKKDMKTGDVLEGVVFELLDSNKQFIKTARTNSQGIAEFTKLKIGNYYVREKSTKPGYVLKTDLESARITNTYKVEKLTIYNEKETIPEDGVIRIMKRDMKTGYVLEGVVFELLDSEKQIIKIGITNSQGIAEFTGLPYGNYYVREKSTKAGYKLKTELESARITSTSKVEILTIYNEKELYGIKITKTDSSTGKTIVADKIKDAEFRLKDPDGKDVYVTKVSDGVYKKDDSSYNYTLKLSSEGKVEIRDLDKKGRYTLTEVKAPTGYQLSTTPLVCDVANITNSFTFKNNPIPKDGVIRITKKDMKTDDVLSGVVFELLDSNKHVIRTGTTNSQGIAEFTGLTYGNYYVREKSTKAGYVLKTDLESAKITSTYKVENLTIYNEKELYGFKITKTDSNTGKTIVGGKTKDAEFRLKDPDGKSVYVTKVSDGVYKKDDSSYNYTLKLSSEGKIEIRDLDKKGRYTLTEVKAPTGYQLSTTPLVCNVSNKTNSFTFKNTPIPKDGSITIIKKDSKTEKVLEGVTFELLNKDKNVIKTSKTSSSGIAGFDNLEYGKYYIREKETISGYKLDSKLRQINITGDEKTITLPLYNEPIEKAIKVIKKDDNENLLRDTEFTLFKKENSSLIKVSSKTTNYYGEVNFNNLSIGQYVLRETKATNGFRPYSKDIEIDLTKQVSPVYTVTLNNYKVEENIPSTGTKGATLFLASGLGIIMLAYLLKKKRIYA